MAIEAAQRAQAPQAQRRPEQRKDTTERKGVGGALARMPLAAGVALMALLLALALPLGNLRALQRATPRDFLSRAGVTSIIEDRAAQAGNAVLAARNAGVDDALTQPVEAAADALARADGARAVSRADQTLTEAMSALTAGANLEGEAATMLRRAADNFAEQGNFLRQEARAYNQEAQKAVELYDKLPARALLPMPELYEGL